MRLTFLLILLVATVFGSGYWYQAFDGVCDLPIQYRVGEVDPRFGTDREELKRIAGNAEKLWEEGTGKELFVYDEQSDFPINLVFDERQENADIEAELREDLEAKQGMSSDVAQKYDRLIAEFRKLRRDYESRVLSYETKLTTYNREVAEWNDRGGAPKDVADELRDDAGDLRTEQDELQALAKTLNALVSELNALGARANTLIKDYNTVVEEYNERVHETGEFTQGDYTQDAVNVYQFNSEDELTIVLAHEFGHALRIAHVGNEESVMYPLMEAQKLSLGLSPEDLAGFTSVCAEAESLPQMLRFVRSLVY